MMGRVLVTGMLFSRPEKRTLSNGSQCVTAIVKSREGKHTRLWHIAAFHKAVQVTLLQLTGGDAVAVQGALRAELYDSSGETGLSCCVIAERALGVHQPCASRAREDQAATQAPCIRFAGAGCSPAQPLILGEGGQ
jgi:single-stranded DNA-binding protein